MSYYLDEHGEREPYLWIEHRFEVYKTTVLTDWTNTARDDTHLVAGAGVEPARMAYETFPYTT